MSGSSDTAYAFNCAAPSHAEGGAAPRKCKASGPTIDIHCHVHIDAADAMVAPYRQLGQEPILHFASDETIAENKRSLGAVRGKLGALEQRLEDMDRLGVDFQVISPSPFQYFYWADPEIGRDTSRAINDWIAEKVGAQERFAGIGTAPLQNTEFAIAEMERAVRELGLKGIEIGTGVGADELSARRLRPFFAKAEELGVFLFMHPNGFSHGSRLAKHNLINLIGNPLETTIAASYMIFDGVMKDLPGLKICLAHGGGFLPMYSGRMDHAHGARADCSSCIQEPPSSYLGQFYFDTAVYTPRQVQYLAETYGADKVLMGTDYPYDMGEPDPVGLVLATDRLSEADKALIVGGNAARLLGLDAEKLKALTQRRR